MGEEGAKRRGEEERRRRGEASRGEDKKEGEESSDRVESNQPFSAGTGAPLWPFAPGSPYKNSKLPSENKMLLVTLARHARARTTVGSRKGVQTEAGRRYCPTTTAGWLLAFSHPHVLCTSAWFQEPQCWMDFTALSMISRLTLIRGSSFNPIREGTLTLIDRTLTVH
jgi:hypothetical protein